jgi:hypothetical protein
MILVILELLIQAVVEVVVVVKAVLVHLVVAELEVLELLSSVTLALLVEQVELLLPQAVIHITPLHHLAHLQLNG